VVLQDSPNVSKKPDAFMFRAEETFFYPEDGSSDIL
jgi:hypothetical protein